MKNYLIFCIVIIPIVLFIVYYILSNDIKKFKIVISKKDYKAIDLGAELKNINKRIFKLVIFRFLLGICLLFISISIIKGQFIYTFLLIVPIIIFAFLGAVQIGKSKSYFDNNDKLLYLVIKKYELKKLME